MRSRRSRSSSRFADTFASRPGLPRISRLPDRRAWSTTAVVAALITGIGIGATMIAGGGSGPTYTTDVAYVPQSRPTATPTTSPTSTPTVTVTGQPQKVAGPARTTTITSDPQQVVKTVIMPGVTVTLPPTTVTAKPPLAAKPPTATVTSTTTTTTTTRTTATATVTAPAKPAAKQPRSVTTQGVPAGAGPAALQSDSSSRCIDVRNAGDGVGRDGTPLQAWDCNGGANQTWSFGQDGTVRSLGLCMDLAWASVADGTQVQLVNCNGGWAQKFALNNNHELVNPTAAKCVTADGTTGGANLILRTCNGAPNQKWHKP